MNKTYRQRANTPAIVEAFLQILTICWFQLRIEENEAPGILCSRREEYLHRHKLKIVLIGFFYFFARNKIAFVFNGLIFIKFSVDHRKSLSNNLLHRIINSFTSGPEKSTLVSPAYITKLTLGSILTMSLI